MSVGERWLSRLFGRRPPARKSRFSAYLSIYNDWDLLAPSLKSLAPFIEELVVVDGAYSWMVPYLRRLGVDPVRSDARVYDALADSGLKYRVVAGLWADEIEKRRAGYDACRTRYVLRVDADEILHFDEPALDAFLADDGAVAEMANPIYVAPGYVIGAAGQESLPATGFLFDRERIGSDIHLNYIWLVLSSFDRLPSAEQRPFAPPSRPVAFAAHLTCWRTPETVVQRGAFYVLNRFRQRGVGWFDDLKGRKLEDLDLLFSRLPAGSFRDMLRHMPFSLGAYDLTANQTLVPTPLSPQQERVFAPLHDRFLASVAEDNERMTHVRQAFGWGGAVVIDLSTEAARSALVKNDEIVVDFSGAPTSLEVKALTLASREPYARTEALGVRLEGRVAHIAAPARPPADALRCVLSMRPQSERERLGDYLFL